MKNFILVFVLSLLLLSFGIFFYQVYIQQKNYFSSKESLKTIPTNEPSVSEDIPSVYKDYSKEDYDTALEQKRVMVLYFTSNWCTDCLTQDNVNISLFQELNKEGVVGLRIHILDSETTNETDALSKKFDVIKESTFVVLTTNGAVGFKQTGLISKDDLKKEILKLKEVDI